MRKPLPENYQAVMPYFIVDNAVAFIEFLKEVFNGVEKNQHLRSEDENKIMHAEVMIDSCTLMLADSTKEYAPRNCGLFVYVHDADATYKKALENGATSIMPPADQPYGRSSGVTDPFGNVWWITSML